MNCKRQRPKNKNRSSFRREFQNRCETNPKQEKGLLDRFSDNLVEEIAAYWLPATSAVNQPEASATEPVSESQTEAAETTDGFAAFEEK